jgi:DNA-binding SARP family transcriptional activator
MARELVVYLAFHREGVRHGDWALALWPERSVSAATVYSTASDARRALGRKADGRLRLPCGPRISLDESVGTDVDRFIASVRSGDYMGAARLVRGPLFGDLRRIDWALLDGTQAHVESLVTQAVLEGAADLLHYGRPADSESMVRSGLVVSPYDERLYRALLLALAAQGNRVRLRAAMAQLLAVAIEESVPLPVGRWETGLAALHPETTTLYQELLGGRPATGGAPARL